MDVMWPLKPDNYNIRQAVFTRVLGIFQSSLLKRLAHLPQPNVDANVDSKLKIAYET